MPQEIQLWPDWNLHTVVTRKQAYASRSEYGQTLFLVVVISGSELRPLGLDVQPFQEFFRLTTLHVTKHIRSVADEQTKFKKRKVDLEERANFHQLDTCAP